MHIKIIIKNIFFLNIILFYSNFIFCKSSENCSDKISLSEHQLKYLKDNTENNVILYLIKQCEKKDAQIKLLQDGKSRKSNYILEMIDALKNRKEKLGSYSDAEEIKFINAKIQELYRQIN